MYNFFLRRQLSMILRSLKTFDFSIATSKVRNMYRLWFVGSEKHLTLMMYQNWTLS